MTKVHIVMESKRMKTEDLKRIILRLFGNEKFYGYEIHKRLTSANIDIEMSRLYRILNEMLTERLLESSWERSHRGPRKKVYKIGKKGSEELGRILLDAISTVHSFYGQYLLGLPSRTNVFDAVCRVLLNGLRSPNAICFVSRSYSRMHERLLRILYSKANQAKFFFVKPSSLEVELDLQNLSFLNGAYNDILLKDSSLDLLVIVGIPQEDLVEATLKEWSRVLNTKGKLAILLPTILVHRHEDPLAIGEYMETYEHEFQRKGGLMKDGFLEGMLKRFFNNVEEKTFVHMSLFQASEPCVLGNNGQEKV